MMGLVVVARLAARHGVAVELRPAAERGTVADVLLPQSVLVPRGFQAAPSRPALHDDRAALAVRPAARPGVRPVRPRRPPPRRRVPAGRRWRLPAAPRTRVRPAGRGR